MTFEEYLVLKKIEAVAFQNSEPERFEEWQQLFTQLHPNSFTEQKKFLLNKIRRQFLIK